MSEAVEALLARVAAHQPKLQPAGRSGFRAATALVLSRQPDPHLVVIRRANRSGDPWSGHAALPGGHHDDTDPDLASTARRETAEEVGLAITDPVGRLDDIGGRTHPGTVSTFVFTVDEPTDLTPEPTEVAGAHWVPLALLTDPDARIRHPSRRVGPWPGWRYLTGLAPPWDELVIWGLTHRILTNFVAVADLP